MRDLLERFKGGDQDAINQLVERSIPFGRIPLTPPLNRAETVQGISIGFRVD